jgi:hypothetical protein
MLYALEVDKKDRYSSVDKMSGCELDALERDKGIFLLVTIVARALDRIRIVIVTGSVLDPTIDCLDGTS